MKSLDLKEGTSTLGRKQSFKLAEAKVASQVWGERDSEEEINEAVPFWSSGIAAIYPLWKLVVECLATLADGEDEEIAGCISRMSLVIQRRTSSLRSSSISSASIPGEEEGSCSTHGLPDPTDSVEGMRGIAALLFDDHYCSVLLDALNEMDSLILDAEEVGDETENDRAEPSTVKLIRLIETLQSADDPNIRKWAIKSLWRLLHVVTRRDDVDALLPGLRSFEDGTARLESISVANLLDMPQCATPLSEQEEQEVEKSTPARKTEIRPYLIRRAFAQSLLSRMVSLEQRGRKKGSRASFVLGSSQSSGSQDSLGPSGVSAVQANEGSSFTTGKLSGFSYNTDTMGSSGLGNVKTRSSTRSETSTGLGSSLAGSEERDTFDEQAGLFSSRDRERGKSSLAGFGQSTAWQALHASSRATTGQLRPMNRQANGMQRKPTGLPATGDSELRASELRMSELRSSGLGGMRSSRLAQLIAAARRSSMSMIGSVHTFVSEDLAFSEREQSALGLDKAFLFPRLTGVSIPEHDVLSGSFRDTKIWSSKGGNGTSALDSSTGSISGPSGIGYVDCVTVFELIVGHLVHPTDVNHYQTVNPFLQRLSIAALELVPTLLCMLTWMTDNLVRKEFVGSLYTLCMARQSNFRLLLSIDSWRTYLLRILQTVPRDRDFRDEAAEVLVQRITDLLCLATLPMYKIFGGNASSVRGSSGIVPAERLVKLGTLIYEVAVLSGWNKDSVDFVRLVLTKQLEMMFSGSFHIKTVLRILQLVEIFVLYMPSKEDALLGFSNRGKLVLQRIKSKKSQLRMLSSRASSMRQASESTDTSSIPGSVESGAIPHRDQPILLEEMLEGLTEVIEEEDEDEDKDDDEDIEESEEDDHRENSFRDERRSRGRSHASLFRTGTGIRSEGSEDSEDVDEEDEEDADNWLWAPLLRQCSPMEMTENQVDHLEFQDPWQRRGVDYGLHRNRNKTLFADLEIVELAVHLAERMQSSGETPGIEADRGEVDEGGCLTATLGRLRSIARRIAKGQEALLEIQEQESIDLNATRKNCAREQIDIQLALIDERVISKGDAFFCKCSHCENMARADLVLRRALYRPKIRSSDLGQEKKLRKSEYVYLVEAGEDKLHVEKIEDPRAEHDATPSMSKLCPICKQNPELTNEPRELVARMESLGLEDDRIASTHPHAPVDWLGFLWHHQHLRCYTCAKVLQTQDKEDPPVYDHIAGWAFCAECAQMRQQSCLYCMQQVVEEDASFNVPSHRTWHTWHLRCERCGVPCEEENWCSVTNTLLCPEHEQEETLHTCAICSCQIEHGQVVSIGESAVVHATFPCLACRGCSKALTPEDALLSSAGNRPVLYCPSCLETCVRPTCAVCKRTITYSEDRFVVVPSREDRMGMVDFDLVDGVIAGADGRLRVHARCFTCRVCQQPIPESDDGPEFYMASSHDTNMLLCKVHRNQLSERIEPEHGLDVSHNANQTDMSDVSQDQNEQAPVSAGHFLYIDKEGLQQGPVDGQQLFQLAVEGAIDANTHVWTPGMSDWKPLAQLS